MPGQRITVKQLFQRIGTYMYGSAKSCIKDKNHLTIRDQDGYCRLCGYKDSAEDSMKEEVRNWMLMALDLEAQDYQDSAGEFNCTMLAENAAFNFDHEEWLDDETHWVWDIAIEATEGYEK